MNILANPKFWSTLASIATVLGFVVVIWTAIMALNQLKEMTRTRHLEAMLRVYDLIGSQEARRHRRFIYTKLKSSPDKLTAEEREHVEQVSIEFDQIGKLVESGLVPQNELFDSHCEVVIRLWTKLESYILHHQKLIGGRHVPHFQKLAQSAQEYYEKHHKENCIRIVGVGREEAPNRIARKNKKKAPTSRSTRTRQS